MNIKNKKAVAFVVVIFLLVSLEIVYIFSELYNEPVKQNIQEQTDAIKFKKEYEELNGKDNGNGSIYRPLSISDKNPFIYKEAKDIIEMIDNKETFVVYFGFGKCPWCRSVLESMIKSAKNKGVKKIYYVDVLNIRDKYELNEKHKAVRTVEGTKDYYTLLKKLNNVLENYEPLTYTENKKEKKVTINEKRIYAPNVIVVNKGKAVSLETGIIETLIDPYMDLTDDMNCQIESLFDCLFEKLENASSVCDLSNNKC